MVLHCAVCGRTDCGPLEQENGVWYPQHFLDVCGRVKRGRLVVEPEAGLVLPLEDERDK
jgi:hypothetical protein